MKFSVVWALAKYLNKNILRQILKDAIDDTKTQWDDFVLSICDKVFDYEG